VEEAANPDRTVSPFRQRILARQTSLIWGVLCMALTVHCTSIERATRVSIAIDAQPELRARIKHVDLVFYAAISKDAWRMRAQERLLPDGERAWPLQWTFSRANPQDLRYTLEAKALDSGGKTLAELRAVGTFRDQQTLQIPLTFDASCREACGEGRTCRESECVDAAVMTSIVAGSSESDSGAPMSAAPSGSPARTDACRAGDPMCMDECGPAHGGCDPVVSCHMQQGKPVCAACPDGFDQESDGRCSALLRELGVEGATLDPSFRPDRTEYTLKTGLLGGMWRLTPTAADGVTLEINGEPLAGGLVTPQLLSAGAEQLALGISAAQGKGRVYHFKLQAQGEELAFLKAPSPTPDAHLGHRIALEGDTLAVAADSDSSSARGVNPLDPARDGAADSGAVHVFRRSASSWEPEAFIKASDATRGAGFGKTLALQGDTLVVGAWNDADRGAAYVYQRTGDTWREQVKLVPDMLQDGANFAQSVALLGDLLVIGAGTFDVGANDTGAAFVYRRNPTDQSWAFERMIAAATPMAVTWFGSSVQLSEDYLVVGATGEGNGSVASGTAYVFDAQTFEQIDVLRPSTPAATGFFGERTAISGDTIAVASYNNNAGLSNGVVYLFARKPDGKFEQSGALQASNATPGDQFGISLALTQDYLLVGAAHESSGTRGINGALSAPPLENSGAAYLFARGSNGFSQVAHIKASEPASGAQLGYDVAISGADIAVSADVDPRAAKGSGAVYLFR
jgi:hypothetical protein